jgi:hypothetical protein
MPGPDLIALFLQNISAVYPEHMLCFFAANLARGNHITFAIDLLDALDAVDSATPGYASEMLQRIGSIDGVGEEQYEAVLQILAEIYVTSGLVRKADRSEGVSFFTHEPSLGQQKNPEFEVRISNNWLVVEVKAPRLIQHGRLRTANEFQLNARLPKGALPEGEKTLPRDNPVKDFLISAEEKFISYEQVRADAYRVLVIIWDDFSNEPIAALQNSGSGLLTANSFYRDDSGDPVVFSHIDGILIVRHQHQLIRATRCEPLIDDLKGAFAYEHNFFPPKAYIECPGGKELPEAMLKALNATPIADCVGAEYHPSELVMWVGKRSPQR